MKSNGDGQRMENTPQRVHIEFSLMEIEQKSK